MKRKFKTVHHIPEELGLGNEVTLTTKEDQTWEGYSWGECIGRRHQDGRIQSFFIKDKEGAGLFEKVRAAIPLIEVPRYIVDRETLESESVVDFFIQYEPVEHCSKLPTIMDGSFDNCINVKYDAAFEVMFVDEEYRKYLVYKYTTEGPFVSSMMDQVAALGESIEEFAEEKMNEFFYNDDNELSAYFYNDIGERLDISYSSVEELLNKVVSIRLIELERVILNN